VTKGVDDALVQPIAEFFYCGVFGVKNNGLVIIWNLTFWLGVSGHVFETELDIMSL
jgi:hypothetical protein